MKFLNKLMIALILFGLGFGHGLRVAVRRQRARPYQPPSRQAVPQPSVEPATEVRTVMDLPTQKRETSNRTMFKAICLWEHRGVIRPDDVSKAGAVGPAQITPIFLKDMNIHLKTCYTMTDCKDYEVAYLLTTEYWARYNLVTDEERARCHLAGPRAMKRMNVWTETSEYWAGVQSYL